MRLILVDSPDEIRGNFFPLALSRPLWELRCGFSSLGEKIIARSGAGSVAYFVSDYMAAAYRAKVEGPVNDVSVLKGEDLLIVDPRIKADGFNVPADGPSEVGLDEKGDVLYARIAKADVAKLAKDGIGDFIASAKENLPNVTTDMPAWNYIWDLILANADQITVDFATAGRSGVEGTIEEPNAIRGNKKDVYIAKGVKVHPMVVIDAEHGPVYID
jgi:hypothetical protein